MRGAASEKIPREQPRVAEVERHFWVRLLAATAVYLRSRHLRRLCRSDFTTTGPMGLAEAHRVPHIQACMRGSRQRNHSSGALRRKLRTQRRKCARGSVQDGGPVRAAWLATGGGGGRASFFSFAKSSFLVKRTNNPCRASGCGTSCLLPANNRAKAWSQRTAINRRKKQSATCQSFHD
ncbi:hypothetical protein MRX96_043953 [Rhipicephalus microplus]